MPLNDRELAALWDLARAARVLERVLDSAEPASFEQDQVLQLALQKATENLGEAARRAPESLRSRHPEIPWRALVAQRNILIHEYDDVTNELLWQNIADGLPLIIRVVESLLPADELPG